MNLVPIRQSVWKQIMEGMARGVIPNYPNVNHLCDNGQDVCREHFDGDVVVARMVVIGGEICESGSCSRVFEAAPFLVEAARFIYVPTDEELEAWSEEEDATSMELTPGYISSMESAMRGEY